MGEVINSNNILEQIDEMMKTYDCVKNISDGKNLSTVCYYTFYDRNTGFRVETFVTVLAWNKK